MPNILAKAGWIKKVVLITVGVILFLIVVGVGCLLVLGKIFQSPEGASCSASKSCANGFTCVGQTCTSGKLGAYCEAKTDCLTPYCVKNVCREDTKIGIFVDEEPKNSQNLKQIKIATITLSLADGSLTVEPLVKDDTFNLNRLNKALAEIKKRPTLKVTVENERIINGQKVLAMEAWDVAKDDPNYAYAVVETLRLEFGLRAEVGK